MSEKASYKALQSSFGKFCGCVASRKWNKQCLRLLQYYRLSHIPYPDVVDKWTSGPTNTGPTSGSVRSRSENQTFKMDETETRDMANCFQKKYKKIFGLLLQSQCSGTTHSTKPLFYSAVAIPEKGRTNKNVSSRYLQFTYHHLLGPYLFLSALIRALNFKDR